MMKAIAKIWREEAGMAPLQLVLMMLVVAGGALWVILNLIGTTAIVGKMEERKTKEFYSADAGITAAMWRIKTNYMLDWLNGLNGKWDETIYAHNPAYENYTLPLAPNGNSVAYTLTPKWILEGLETPNTTQYRTPADNVSVYGSYIGAASDGHGQNKILIYYDGNAGPLSITRVGYWLPPGLDYVRGPSSVEDNTTNPLHSYLKSGYPKVVGFRGGHSIEWDFSQAVSFNLFPSVGFGQAAINFEFTPNINKSGGFCWVVTNIPSNYLAWSALNIFEVKSTATSPSGENTTVTSYSIRNVGDTFGAAMDGDYSASGNTLTRPSTSNSTDNRDRLYKETNFTVRDIPTNAQVEHIFLYWTGWKCKPWNSMTATTVATFPAKYKVDRVLVTCNTTAGGSIKFSENVTASVTQSMINYSSGSQHGWSYSGFADITGRVKDYFNSHGGGFVGNGTYTVTHTDFKSGSTAPSTGGPWYALYNYNSGDQTAPYGGESIVGYTRYPLGSPRNGGDPNNPTVGTNTDNQTTPRVINEGSGNSDLWAYSAWSVVIVYTSPSTLGHQLYRFDTFVYGDENVGVPTKTISGFVVPDLTDEVNAARMTCFVAEGDAQYTGDSVKVNGTTLATTSDNPSDNVWNSQSLIGTQMITGIDIDTWNLSKSIILPGATQATVQLPTQNDSWSLVYMILAFRSKITSGGSFIYDIQ